VKTPRQPENSDYHELENLIFNQRAFSCAPKPCKKKQGFVAQVGAAFYLGR
jgi:hypothetical protein